MLKQISLNPAIGNSSMYAMNASSSTVADNSKFKMELDKIADKNELIEQMESLLQDVENIKGKIQEDLTVDNIMEYKDTIQLFLNFYVDNMINYQDVTLRHPKYGYAQKMTVVRDIEKEVNELEDIMSLIDTKTGHLDVLDKIGEINGMILNLVL